MDKRKLKQSKKLEIREYTFIKSKNLIFRVIGNIHPQNGYICSIRYIKKCGKYIKALKYGTMFQAPDVLSVYGDLLKWVPFYSMHYGIIPPQLIEGQYDPINRYKKLKLDYDNENIDEHERLCLDIGSCLEQNIKIPESSIGIGGSTLLGLHNVNSDIDMHIYGKKWCKLVENNLDKISSLFGGKKVGIEDSKKLGMFYELREIDSPSNEDFFYNSASLRSRFSFLIQKKKIDFQYIPTNDYIALRKLPKISLGPPEKVLFYISNSDEALYYPGVLQCEKIRMDNAKHQNCNVIFRDKRCQFLKEGDIAKIVCRKLIIEDKISRIPSYLDITLRNVYVGEKLLSWTPKCIRAFDNIKGVCNGR